MAYFVAVLSTDTLKQTQHKTLDCMPPYNLPASTHDITMFRGGAQVDPSKRNNKANWDRHALYFHIPEGKKLIGDSGYKGEPLKISTTLSEHKSDTKHFFARAKSRQETFNTRLKFFNVLSGRFRHGKGADKVKILVTPTVAVDRRCVATPVESSSSVALDRL